MSKNGRLDSSGLSSMAYFWHLSLAFHVFYCCCNHVFEENITNSSSRAEPKSVWNVFDVKKAMEYEGISSNWYLAWRRWKMNWESGRIILFLLQAIRSGCIIYSSLCFLSLQTHVDWKVIKNILFPLHAHFRIEWNYIFLLFFFFAGKKNCILSGNYMWNVFFFL